MPQGVFQLYTTAKTCILYLEYKGKKGNLEFIYINHVGFTLDKNKIQQNDLMKYFKDTNAFPNVSKFSYDEIANNNFSFKIYQNQINEGVELSEILEFSRIPIKLERERIW